MRHTDELRFYIVQYTLLPLHHTKVDYINKAIITPFFTRVCVEINDIERRYYAHYHLVCNVLA